MIDLSKALPEGQSRQPAFFDLGLAANLARISSQRKMYQAFLEAVRLYLEADGAVLYRLRTSRDGLRRAVVAGEPPDEIGDSLAAAFADQKRPILPASLLLAPLRLRERLVGVVAVRRAGGFDRGTGYDLLRLCRLLAQEISQREDRRIARVLEEINREILAELRPRDVAYQILKGLASLLRYDHSAALLLYDPKARAFRVDAERIAWRKGKSPHVGHEQPVSASLARTLRAADPPVILEPQGELATVLSGPREDAAPEATSSLVAPLVLRGELVGLLRVAAWRRPAFTRRDGRIVERFLLPAVHSLGHARLHFDQERRAVETARKGQLMSIARVVAHDINNAIGTILPLAQQVACEVEEGSVDLATLGEDLRLIEEKADLARRLFGRLLAQERSVTARSLSIDLNRVVKDRLDLLASAARRRKAVVRAELEPGLPPARMARQNLEHLVWNLLENAVDSLPLSGGEVRVRSNAAEPGWIALRIVDSGCGIPEELRQRILEPFFTTKPEGTGLGLPLCLSLVREAGGRLAIDSAPRRGTEVTVHLPVAREGDA